MCQKKENEELNDKELSEIAGGTIPAYQQKEIEENEHSAFEQSFLDDSPSSSQ